MQFTQSKGRAHFQKRTQLVRPSLEGKRKVRPWFAFIMIFSILLPLIAIWLPLMDKKSLFRVRKVSLSGNYYCTHGEIYAILENQESNVLTFSEQEIERRLEQELNYVKQVHISKSVVNRSLDIHVTERKPYVYLRYRLSGGVRFVLVDREGYVLEYSDEPRASDAIAIIVADRQRLPELGDRVRSDAVRLGLVVLHSISGAATGISSGLRTIDAKHPHKIILQFEELPKVWLASDSIGLGLRYIDLFLKQGIHTTNTGKPNSNDPNGYLDVRFEGAIYRGGGI